jgi:hypothetical protein
MKCQQYWEDPPQRGHEITEEQAAHLAECANCATQWQAHQALASGLRSLGEEWRKLEAPGRVEAGLMSAFRLQAGFQVRRTVERSWWTPVLAWASAAAAMVALAAFLIRGYQPAPEKPGTVAAPHHTARPEVLVAAAVDADSEDESAILGEGFVRLPNAAPIDPNESFDVVHVEAQGSELIAMGVSLSEDRAAETLAADFALGADGTARAVRLAPDGGTY